MAAGKRYGAGVFDYAGENLEGDGGEKEINGSFLFVNRGSKFALQEKIREDNIFERIISVFNLERVKTNRRQRGSIEGDVAQIGGNHFPLTGI